MFIHPPQVNLIVPLAALVLRLRLRPRRSGLLLPRHLPCRPQLLYLYSARQLIRAKILHFRRLLNEALQVFNLELAPVRSVRDHFHFRDLFYFPTILGSCWGWSSQEY